MEGRQTQASIFYQICGPASYLFIILILLNVNFCITVDVKPQKELYLPDYTLYHNLSSVQRELQTLVNTYPDFVRLNLNYRSRQDRPQMLLQVTNFTQDSVSTRKPVQKVKMFLSYGEHAREFLPVETMFFLLKNLTEGVRSPEGSGPWLYSQYILTHVDLHLLAMANPDGRMYVESSHNYCWRGTSTGVDLNRNFNWEYGKRGSSADPSDEEYRGPHAFSEPECTIFQRLTQDIHFDLFISFHSGIRQIYIPYADTYSQTVKRQPANIDGITNLARLLASSTVHRYQYGRAMDLTFYTADGTSFDYMAGVRKIPFSLAIELWGSSNHRGASCFDEFNPRSEKLQHELSLIHPLYVKLFEYMIHWKNPSESNQSEKSNMLHNNLTSLKKPSPSHFVAYVLMTAVALVIVILVLQGRVLMCPSWQHRRRVIRLKTLSSTLSLWGVVKSM